MFSFIEKLFSKIYSHFPISAIFVEFGVIYCDLKKKIFFLGCYFTYGIRQNLFFYRKIVLAIFRVYGVYFLFDFCKK